MTTAASASGSGRDGNGAGRTPGPFVAARPGSAWIRCGGDHGAGVGAGRAGQVDERARRLSHEEFWVASLFAADGHAVRSLPESRGGGRRPDLVVCAATVEVKSFLPLEERGRPPTGLSVFNKLVDGAGQADAVILYGRGSGLTQEAVRRGLARLEAAGRAPSLASVRVVGDGFDLAWSRTPVLARRSPALAPSARAAGPELEL